MPLLPLVVWFGSKQPRSPGAEQPTQVWAVSFAHGSPGSLGPREPGAGCGCDPLGYEGVVLLQARAALTDVAAEWPPAPYHRPCFTSPVLRLR